MNIANKLTILRVALIPFFVFFLMNADMWGGASKWIAVVIFCIACATDWFDGKLARKYNLVSTFGKFADPLADKILVSSTLICFTELGYIASWIVIIIVAREFIISGFRLVAAEKGRVIAANMWGKVKTFETMVMLIFVMMQLPWDWAYYVGQVLIYAALALTVISLLTYIVANISIFRED